MNRRNLFHLTAAAAAAPGFVLPAAAQAQAATASWQPAVLDAHQNETLIALVDLIIPATDTPGARHAGVNRYIDLLLRDGEDAPRRQFLEGLQTLDGYALRKHGKPFVRCAASDQIALLTALDQGADTELAAGTRFFRTLKSTTARIYYATETGFRELNKGGRVPAHYGCKHPEHA